MTLQESLKQIDLQVVKDFVLAVHKMISSLMVQPHASGGAAAPPGDTDYGSADLSGATPDGGWISNDELKATQQKMTEAIKTESWIDGALFAVKLMSALGAI